jgi:hypothetical protein
MKNVQIIDGAMNCTFPIFQFEDHQFTLVFPQPGQDIAFIDEVYDRLTKSEAKSAFDGVWDRPIAKAAISGLHGTLFYEFESRKVFFPTSRRECDWDDDAINAAQRQIIANARIQGTE